MNVWTLIPADLKQNMQALDAMGLRHEARESIEARAALILATFKAPTALDHCWALEQAAGDYLRAQRVVIEQQMAFEFGEPQTTICEWL